MRGHLTFLAALFRDVAIIVTVVLLFFALDAGRVEGPSIGPRGPQGERGPAGADAPPCECAALKDMALEAKEAIEARLDALDGKGDEPQPTLLGELESRVTKLEARPECKCEKSAPKPCPEKRR